MTKTATDWEAIEREYRAGQLSVSEIGRQYGVSHTAIQKRAKKFEWPRNLVAKVREAVATKLVADEVAAETERQAIDVAAQRGVAIVREHRTDIGKGRRLVELLMAELEGATLNVAEVEQAIEDETATDSNGQRRSAMLKAVSLATRAGVISNLATAMKTLVGLERQAFNLDEGGADGGAAGGNQIQRIEYIVVDPQNPDTAGVPPSPGSETV